MEKKIDPFIFNQKFGGNLTLPSMLKVLFNLIRVYVAYGFCCSSFHAEQEILGFLRNVIRVRANEFTQAYGTKGKYNNERMIKKYEKRLPLLIDNLRKAPKGQSGIKVKVEGAVVAEHLYFI